MFKIENNIAYEPPVSGQKAKEKQAILNTVSLLKPGESIFIEDSIILYGSLKKFIEDVLKERFHQKNLVYKKVEEGTRIWCLLPTKPL